MKTNTLENHPVVSQTEWLAARKELLAKEKQVTRLNDQVSEARRALPWVKVDKNYVFDTTEGKQTLGDLFGGNSQLLIYHFMFGPGWKEGCPGCSFLSDHIDGANLHLAHHDVSVVVVSRAPLKELLPFKKRMEWKFKWVSSDGGDFNFDYHASISDGELAAGKYESNFELKDVAEDDTPEDRERPGTSVFYKNAAGEIFHTYSSYSRAGDILIGAHNFLDLTPKGRNEDGIMNWMRHHDRYQDQPQQAHSCCNG